jgi:hypothetical protein
MSFWEQPAMAIVFMLWAECRSADTIRNLSSHFGGLKYAQLDGREITWRVDVPTRSDGRHSMAVWSEGLSARGVRTVQDAVESSEAGLRLYHHLVAAPPFSYARVGWDADTIEMADLSEYLEAQDGRKYLPLQCVLEETLFNELGRPDGCSLFRPGYRWRPYRGEEYQPLGSNDFPELLRLQQRLFPS